MLKLQIVIRSLKFGIVRRKKGVSVSGYDVLGVFLGLVFGLCFFFLPAPGKYHAYICTVVFSFVLNMENILPSISGTMLKRNGLSNTELCTVSYFLTVYRIRGKNADSAEQNKGCARDWRQYILNIQYKRKYHSTVHVGMIYTRGWQKKKTQPKNQAHENTKT